jgi:hypothetical protein
MRHAIEALAIQLRQQADVQHKKARAHLEELSAPVAEEGEADFLNHARRRDEAERDAEVASVVVETTMRVTQKFLDEAHGDRKPEKKMTIHEYDRGLDARG